jgi:hypothetical protein
MLLRKLRERLEFRGPVLYGTTKEGGSMKHNRPWSNEKRSLDTPKVSEAIFWINQLKETQLFLANQFNDFRLLTLGLAASIGLPMSIYYVTRSSKPQKVVEAVTDPLHSGENVLLASEVHTNLLSEILEAWAEFAQAPQNLRLVTQSGLTLDSDALRGEPGTLSGLHPTQPTGPLGYGLVRIPDDEAATLEFLGQQARIVNIRLIE